MDAETERDSNQLCADDSKVLHGGSERDCRRRQETKTQAGQNGFSATGQVGLVAHGFSVAAKSVHVFVICPNLDSPDVCGELQEAVKDAIDRRPQATFTEFGLSRKAHDGLKCWNEILQLRGKVSDFLADSFGGVV